MSKHNAHPNRHRHATNDRRRATPYTAIGLVLGAGVGVTVGALLGGPAIALGLCIGAGVGVVIGAALDGQSDSDGQEESLG